MRRPWGCRLSLTLRDIRVLRDRLLADTDWDRAAHAYAAEHDPRPDATGPAFTNHPGERPDGVAEEEQLQS